MKARNLLLLVLISVIPLSDAECQANREVRNAPALRGVRSVRVHIFTDLDSAALSYLVNRGLKNAGLIVSREAGDYILVQCNSDHTEKNVVCDMNLFRRLILPDTQGVGVMASVWQSGFPRVDVVEPSNTATSTAMTVVERHVNAFVIDWLKANRSR